MSDLEWTDEGAPRSRRFDDVYFSREGGLAESRAVFLEGCGLPDAWAGRRRFAVGELGFGTGLNVLALLQLWARTRPSGGRLHVFSVEAFPISPDEAARALAVWPELADLAARLLARWPQAQGVRRIDWPEIGATLDVAVAEAATALRDWDGAADAWFLDGFSPAKNPEMWRDEVFALVQVRSAPGARLATFTVAGVVRRGLAAHGFDVERRPGHGGKRQRLEARLAGVPTGPDAPADALVIGGGIAGASLARALSAENVPVRVLRGPGRGASGNPAALVTPRYEVGDTPAARFYAQAFRRAVDVYADAPGAVLDTGVVQLGAPDEAGRFERLARSPLFGPGELQVQDRPDGPALLAREALVIDPKRIVEVWLADVPVIEAEAARLERSDAGWRVLGQGGETLAEASCVILAAGAGMLTLTPELGLGAVRGQVSLAPGLEGPAAAWGGYCAPTPGGLLFGATHDRDEVSPEVRAADHQRNLETLRRRFPELAEAAAQGPDLQGRAAVRAAARDRLPLAGRHPDPDSTGLWVLAGLGSRGFTTAPLLAEHLAALLAGAASPLPAPAACVVDPSRFLKRERRRAQNTRPSL
jgi:tRNA 5-methylaminomethyl-2-thiouridine biosynthesis bifunctional protein